MTHGEGMSVDDRTRGLPRNQHLVAASKWPVVGEKLPAGGEPARSLRVEGAVGRPRTWDFAELRALGEVDRVVDIHCVTRWSKLGAQFRGVPLHRVLEVVEPLPEARYISFRARSERRHSTSLSIEEALSHEVLLAFEFDGQELSLEHGGPLRSIVPGKYFYKSLKWLETIELLPEDRLGYWEAEAGYHNHADPWLEERYAAPDLDRAEVRRLLESRDFRGRELRSLAASSRDLRGLDARGALLRDARFDRADLRDARLDGANLSNADLSGADLRGASFRDADLEGAEFAASRLAHADFTGASLFGATFLGTGPDGELAPASTGAEVDATTRFEAAVLEQLAPAQQEYLRVARET